MVNNLKNLQWNCRSIRNKHDFQINNAKYDIILLVETWLKEDDSFKLRGFTTVRFDRLKRKGGGIAILIKEGLLFDKIVLNFTSHSLETGSIVIDTDFGEILITVCYRCQEFNISLREWTSFLNALVQANIRHTIVAGDFNAHHPLWGSPKSCSNGNLIVDNLDFDTLVLLNNGNPTRIGLSCSGNNYSNLDLTFASPDLALLVSNWDVLEDKWGSDHFPVEFQVGIEPSFQKTVFYKYNFKKMNLELFLSLKDNRGMTE